MVMQPIRQLMYALACLMLGIVVCVLLKPHGLLANSGISYYGTFRITLASYAIALLGSAWFTYRAGHLLLVSSLAVQRLACYSFSVLIVGIFLTPYSLNSVFDWTHTILGSILFAGQLLLTGWLTVQSKYRPSLTCFWILELLAGIMCAIYVRLPQGYLIEFQVLFQVMFTTCFTGYLRMVRITASQP